MILNAVDVIDAGKNARGSARENTVTSTSGHIKCGDKYLRCVDFLDLLIANSVIIFRLGQKFNWR
jgi:hypothetical protein